MSETTKLAVPLLGGVLLLKHTSFFGLSMQEREQLKKNIMDELKRAFELATKNGVAPLVIPGGMQVMYIGPDGKVDKLGAVEE